MCACLLLILFLIGFFSYYWVVRFLCILWITVFYPIVSFQLFSFSLWSISSFLEIIFLRVEVLKFNQTILSIVSWIMPLMWYLKKSSLYLRSSKFSLLWSSRCFMGLHFTFKITVHFQLIFFVQGISFLSRFIYIF